MKADGGGQSPSEPLTRGDQNVSDARRTELKDAIDEFAESGAMRRAALSMAIQTVEKVPYGPPGEAKIIALAEAYLKFLTGGSSK